MNRLMWEGRRYCGVNGSVHFEHLQEDRVVHNGGRGRRSRYADEGGTERI